MSAVDMGMDVETGIDLSLLVDVDAPVPCGNSGHLHPRHSAGHAGDAVWMITMVCRPCGYSSRYPACAKFVERMQFEDTRMRCVSCRRSDYAREFLRKVESL